MPSKQAIRKYEQFHGKTPRTVTTMEIKDLNTFIYLADPEIITYASNKINGGGNGKRTYFKHKFNKSTKLYCSPDGKMLIIKGPKLKVTSRGIIG